MPEQTEKRSYKDTLNLPKTAFSMKANLVQNEPASLKRWSQQKLYEKLRHARRGAPRYAFHDGPPYANGSIHLGHLLNKVLKDFVVRSRTMAGFDCPYTPGWDCHGLPIEHKVMQELGEKAKEMEPFQIRRKCQAYAEKFVKLQSAQMQRLLTLADYDEPYLTMAPGYEGAVLDVFADLVGKGLVFRMKKPVHWSIENRTALAEAELEYYDREDTSVYVEFEVTDPRKLSAELNAPQGERVHLMIWTTTPWTLPANLAVAVAPKAEYSLFEYERDGAKRHVIMAEQLHKHVFEQVSKHESGGHKRLGTCNGAALVGLQYTHPFVQRTGGVFDADYVTLEDGTGLVHTAPGHGVEDYQTGLRVGLDIYCPVQKDGTFDDTAPDWLQGKSVWEANDLVVAHLRDSGHLFHAHKFTHSYPHDWRGKTPVIFRATEQWFVGVDREFRLDDDPSWFPPRSLRGRALECVGLSLDAPQSPMQERMLREFHQALQRGTPAGTWLEGSQNRFEELVRLVQEDPSRAPDLIREGNKAVRFIPAWGRNRMRGMLETRPDWCVSRQRAWGLPIPAFFGQDETQVLLTEASVRAVADKLREHGSDYWFKATPQELLENYDPATDPDAPDWLASSLKPQASSLTKSNDIFDVWFESGSSWRAALQRMQGDYPADLYLEGSDQHRGWFQTSLLPALGVTGTSPFKSVLTHGFMVDKEGHKMSKSVGNTLEVEALLKDFGADVCRWWVSSLSYENDIKVDVSYFKVAGEEYRKVRNTLRFLMGNLGDFDPSQDRYAFTEADATSIDAWAMGELNRVIAAVTDGYENFQYRRVHEAIFNFCNDTLSAVYLAATKDRLYCDRPDSARRRRTQTAMFDIASAVIRLMAPILPHTADEAWAALTEPGSGFRVPGSGAESEPQLLSVHLARLPQTIPGIVVHDAWPTLIEQRDNWMKAIEDARQSQGIDNPLDIGLIVPPGDGALIGFDLVDLADLCGISRFVWHDAAEGPTITDLSEEPRCERSWKRDGTVHHRSDGGELSQRDAEAVGVT